MTDDDEKSYSTLLLLILISHFLQTLQYNVPYWIARKIHWIKFHFLSSLIFFKKSESKSILQGELEIFNLKILDTNKQH